MKRVTTLLARATLALALFSAFCFSSFSHAASVSDLLISEIMANPAAVSDTNGEWFELFNPTADTINLDGLTLSDDGANSVLLSGSNLSINSGDYFVLARNNDSLINGGFVADYSYGSGFTLSNSSDEIVFSDSNGELLRLNFSGAFVSSGASMELLSDTMLLSNYALSTTAYGAGDLGTPGIAGNFTYSLSPSPVPLPGTAWLMLSGLAGLLSFKRKFIKT